jgi:hypothetical protein
LYIAQGHYISKPAAIELVRAFGDDFTTTDAAVKRCVSLVRELDRERQVSQGALAGKASLEEECGRLAGDLEAARQELAHVRRQLAEEARLENIVRESLSPPNYKFKKADEYQKEAAGV